MTKYIVKPIEDIIDYSDELREGKTVTIFITEYLDRYKFAPTLWLNFPDVDKGEEGFIKDYQIKSIINFCEICKFQDTVIVGCDAGLSRSPAIACAIASINGDIEESKRLKETHRFLNKYIYTEILSYSIIES